MEEQRRVQEAEGGRGTAGEPNSQQNPSSTSGTSGWMISVPHHRSSTRLGGTAHETLPGGNEMDVTRLTEDEQIALAIQMSMSQAESTRLSIELLVKEDTTLSFSRFLQTPMMLK